MLNVYQENREAETVEICFRANGKKPLMLKLTNNFRVRHEEAAANFGGWCMGIPRQIDAG